MEKEQINDMNIFSSIFELNSYISLYQILHRYPVLRMMGLVRDDTAKYKSFKSLNWIEKSSNTL